MDMNMVVFDTLKLSRKLEGAGFTREQATGAAEALSDTFTDNVATKADVDAVRKDLKVEIDAVRKDLKAEIDAVRKDLKAEIAELRGEIKLNRWMLALVITVTVIPFIRDML